MQTCKTCGTTNPDSAVFCKDCGASLRNPQNPAFFNQETELIGGVEARYLRAFTGQNFDRYAAVWRKQQRRPLGVGFHWTAFFFPVSWMLSRRMFLAPLCLYLYTALTIILFATVGLGAIERAEAQRDLVPEVTYEEIFSGTETLTGEQMRVYLERPEVKSRLAEYEAYQRAQDRVNLAWLLLGGLLFLGTVGVGLIAALFADRIYFLYARRKIRAVCAQYPNEELRLLLCKDRGGVRRLYLLFSPELWMDGLIALVLVIWLLAVILL